MKKEYKDPVVENLLLKHNIITASTPDGANGKSTSGTNDEVGGNPGDE